MLKFCTRLILTLASLTVFVPPLQADDLQHGGLTAMNGINFSEYENFHRDWQMVTIRFRKDTGEMRITYANKLAMDTLREGKTNYPDGAVFAKVGLVTGEDIQFPSSAIPRAVRRYQIMVKSKKTYPATAGWGYALFDAQGKTYPDDPKVAQEACHACHMIVDNRGHVFSEPFSIISAGKPKKLPAAPSPFFKNVSRESLPKVLWEHIPKQYSQLRYLENKLLQQKVFAGTLDELKPLLEKEALLAQRPALFVSRDERQFTIAVPLKISHCLNESGAELITSSGNNGIKTLKVCLHD